MENSFHFNSMKIHSMIHKDVFKKVKPYGLTIGQPKVLEYLFYHNGASNKEIANACFIEPPSLSSVLDRMEKQGYVRRDSHENNRRMIQVHLTDEGRNLAQYVINEFNTVEEVTFEGISKQEKEAFLATFAKIAKNLEQSF